MKPMGIRMLAVPVLLAATVSFASAQEGAKAQARETAQDVKGAATKTGNAVGDWWITLKIHSQFVPEDTLENSDIDVDTKKGVVMLNGTVASEAGRARAVAIAKATDGVNSVTDNLRIAAGTDMTTAARDAGARAADKSKEVARDTRDATKEAARDTRDATKEAARDTRDAAKEATGTTGKAMTDGWIKSKIAAQFVTERLARQERHRHRHLEGRGDAERCGPHHGGEGPCHRDRESHRRREGRAEQPEGRSGREVTSRAVASANGLVTGN